MPCALTGKITQVRLEIVEDIRRWETLPGEGLQGAGTILLEWGPSSWVILMDFSEAAPPLGSPDTASALGTNAAGGWTRIKPNSFYQR